jgi:secondary thiamine-phosphate synthase enzyme
MLKTALLQQAALCVIMMGMVKTEEIQVTTEGGCSIVDITAQVAEAVANSQIQNGAVVVFNIGSTAAITTIEYEPGLVNYDMAEALEKIAPQEGFYEHEKTWNDDNGHAHIRASLLGPSLNVPIVKGQLTLGTWQQIVLIDFDTRPRTRQVICQIIGE